MEYSNIFDTHTHYHDKAFESDMPTVLNTLPQEGVVGIINCGTDIPTSKQTLLLSETYSYIYAAVGIHGLDIKNAHPSQIDQIFLLAQNKKCVAIGEIGLDYHYESESREQQLFYFEEQLKIAKAQNLPVIVHDREAHGDILPLLQKYSPMGVVHCFSGSIEFAKEICRLGMYIGLGGAVTFKNARKPLEVAASVPVDRLLLETDCPYMTPVPYRGSRNDSLKIPIVAKVIAEIRGMDTQNLIDITTNNAKALFQIA